MITRLRSKPWKLPVGALRCVSEGVDMGWRTVVGTCCGGCYHPQIASKPLLLVPVNVTLFGQMFVEMLKIKTLR